MLKNILGFSNKVTLPALLLTTENPTIYKAFQDVSNKFTGKIFIIPFWLRSIYVYQNL